MPLMPCPHCSKLIPTAANFCPYCTQPIGPRAWIWLRSQLIGIMVGMALMAMIVGVFALPRVPAAIPTNAPTIGPMPTLGGDAKMALIPAGPFKMGSDQGDGDERPVHTVTLNAFLMDKYEATNADYAGCVAAGKCLMPTDEDSKTRKGYYADKQYANYPVINVSWEEANTYCKWHIDGGRLPTEAEWERAARGGAEGKQYPWGDTLPVCTTGAENGAQFNSCNPQDTIMVGSFAPNKYGLYDMAGNVWEWTTDWYEAIYYQNSPGQNPSGPQSSNQNVHVVRGGSWLVNSDYLRVADRFGLLPDYRANNLGFCCVRSK
jgi:eukaryotic-like serine/threonine-protein kinase